MAYIYLPQKYLGHTYNCVAWNMGGLCKQVKIVSRRMVNGIAYAELQSAMTGAYMGLVPTRDLLQVSDTKPTISQKIAIIKVLHQHKLQKERLTNAADLLATKSNGKPVSDNPESNPRPIAKPPLAAPVHHKAVQRFRQHTGGLSEAMAIERFRDYASGKLGKRQVKQNAKKARIIGQDIADANDNAILKELLKQV